MSLQPPGLPRAHLADRTALDRRFARGDQAPRRPETFPMPPMIDAPTCVSGARPCRRAHTVRGSTNRDRGSARRARAAAASRAALCRLDVLLPATDGGLGERCATASRRPKRCSPRYSFARNSSETSGRSTASMRSPDTAVRRRGARVTAANGTLAGTCGSVRRWRTTSRKRSRDARAAGPARKTIAKGELRLGVEA